MNNELEILQRLTKLEREIDNLKRIEVPQAYTHPSFVGARYVRTIAGQTFNDSSITILNLDVLDYDTDSAVTTGASWKFTAPSAGYYLTNVRLMFATTTTWAENEHVILYYYVNNAFVCQIERSNGLDSSAATAAASCGGTVVDYLGAGSYLDVRVYQNCGSALSLQSTAGYNYIEISKIG